MNTLPTVFDLKQSGAKVSTNFKNETKFSTNPLCGTMLPDVAAFPKIVSCIPAVAALPNTDWWDIKEFVAYEKQWRALNDKIKSMRLGIESIHSNIFISPCFVRRNAALLGLIFHAIKLSQSATALISGYFYRRNWHRNIVS